MQRSLPFEGSCPAGYHKRKAYTSRAGHRVGPRCVRSTTVYANTSREFKQKMAQKQTRRMRQYIPSIRSLSRKACPPGQIERKSYIRKYSTALRKSGFTVRRKSGKTYRVYPTARPAYVKSRCVKDLGKPGKGPQAIGPLRKGELAKHGYSWADSESKRHEALRKAIGEFGPLGVFRKLDAVAKLMLRTAPRPSAVFKGDRNWVQKAYGPLKAF